MGRKSERTTQHMANCVISSSPLPYTPWNMYICMCTHSFPSLWTETFILWRKKKEKERDFPVVWYLPLSSLLAVYLTCLICIFSTRLFFLICKERETGERERKRDQRLGPPLWWYLWPLSLVNIHPFFKTGIGACVCLFVWWHRFIIKSIGHIYRRKRFQSRTHTWLANA